MAAKGHPTIASIIGNRPMVDLQSFSTVEGLAVAQQYRAHPGDIIISTFPKTGTSWMQQICHQLRTGGDTDFDEITEVVPWLEVCPSLMIDIDAIPHKATPRCFKSHQLLGALAHLEEDGARFICTMRDPEKTIISHFKFMHSHGHQSTASHNINEFIQSSFTLGSDVEGDLSPQFGGTLWDQYAEYWRCKDHPNVTVLVFEHLVEDLQPHLEGLNTFMGLVPLEANRRAIVLEYSHRKWMESHSEMFDDHCLGARINTLKGVQFDAVSKVGHDIKDSKVVVNLNEKSKAIMAQMWQEKMEPVTGYSCYLDMINSLRGSFE